MKSESIKHLAIALCKAQSEMGGAVKDAANPFFKSNYADLTSVVKAIKEAFSSNGLSYTQFPVNDGDKIGVHTILMHESGEYIESEYYLPIVKQDPQAAGSAITYARRYALQAIAGIPTADDDAEAAMLRGVPYTEAQKAQFDELLKNEKAQELFCFVKVVGDDIYSALYNTFPQGAKQKNKKQCDELVEKGRQMMENLTDMVRSRIHDSDPSVLELTDELERNEKAILVERLEPAEIAYLKQVKSEQAA